jgi:general stress protein 26
MENNSSKIEDLFEEQAIQKCQQLVKHQNTCLFSTAIHHVPQTTRPMSVQGVDEEGNFWFLSSKDSNKNAQILEDDRVQLYFQNVSDYEFMTIYGRATISRDKQKIDEYWEDIAKAWFPEGKDDPRITVIKVKPESGFYWDTKSGKVVSMLKILASAVTGKTLQEGVEGTISTRR